jgi:hypothetical protein
MDPESRTTSWWDGRAKQLQARGVAALITVVLNWAALKKWSVELV